MSSGSTSATCGPMSGVPPTLNLILRLWSVMTAQSVTSPRAGGGRDRDERRMRAVMGSRPHS